MNLLNEEQKDMSINLELLPKTDKSVRGALSGIVATIPMTAAMYLTRGLFTGHARTTLPPQQITDDLLNSTSTYKKITQPEHPKLAVASHFGYGASTGILYAHIAEKISNKPLVSGICFGLGVWAASYAGWLPVAGLQPSPEKQPEGRNTAMIFSHVVWGAVLGLTNSYLSQKKMRAAWKGRRSLLPAKS